MKKEVYLKFLISFQTYLSSGVANIVQRCEHRSGEWAKGGPSIPKDFHIVTLYVSNEDIQVPLPAYQSFQLNLEYFILYGHKEKLYDLLLLHLQ